MSFFNSFFSSKSSINPLIPIPNYKQLVSLTNFNERELKRLFSRYISLSHPLTGYLEKIPFIQQPEVIFCPLISLAYDMEYRNLIRMKNERKLIDLETSEPLPRESAAIPSMPLTSQPSEIPINLPSNESKSIEQEISMKKEIPNLNGIDFETYVKILSVFSPKASHGVKLSYLYELIEGNGSQCITKEQYLEFLAQLYQGFVPRVLFDEGRIDEIWKSVNSICGTPTITIDQMNLLVSLIDIHLYMTISF